MKSIAYAAALVALSSNFAAADTITAKEIAAGISDSKTELEQESWWKENMGDKSHEISGKVVDVQQGTLSGYWVHLNIGKGIKVMCGFEAEQKAVVQSLRKGAPFTCKGRVSSTWTVVFGPSFNIDCSAL
ncbi:MULTISPECIES: hypothetical protein [unclassified Mesorhizobium]|uniref:hypothetical protein n=1 Tax=unclassified Mesorhizobium TaxID=325217 RepID=UPI001CCEB6F2|nr:MULTISPECIES: hypothetical protein [unclassified Mesorhizobium]MBZ9743171.1 hypothetical protein [Mesorhizobium sp. CO1-1-4]MBZ9801789.1 hypothetical protein [Mesorhizobium sp. ES1-6]